MIVLLAAVVFWRQPRLALRPNTIAAVLCYLAGPSIPERFEGIVELDGRERDRRVCELDLKFGMWLNESSGLKDMGVIDVESSRT